jgi:hypothetical protein
VYGEVLKIDPHNGRALARQATIDVYHGHAATVPSRLRTVLTDARLPADAKAEIGFALGGALDASGDYAAAFSTFEQANRDAASAAHPSLRYDRAAHERLIDMLIALPHQTRGTMPASCDAPVFVCGMFRSGSTLIEQILSRHSDVTAGGELEIIPAMAAGMRSYPGALAEITEDVVADLTAQYLAEARTLNPGTGVLIDKRPDNFLHIGLIKRMFPSARIVHTVRSPLDIMLSVYFLYFSDSIAYGHHLGDIAHYISQYQRLMAHWHVMYPGDIFDVSYDEVVYSPEPMIAALLKFCELEWEDSVLASPDTAGVVRTASVWQVRQPLHRRSSGRWRNYAAQLAALRDQLGALAQCMDN